MGIDPGCGGPADGVDHRAPELQVLAAQHGPGNLIVVKDKEEDIDDEGSEGSDRDDYFPLPGLPVVIHDIGVLWEIKNPDLPPYEE